MQDRRDKVRVERDQLYFSHFTGDEASKTEWERILNVSRHAVQMIDS